MGPADFKIPEFGSYFNADAFESTYERESPSASSTSTSYRTPSASAEPEPEYEEPKKVPEIEVYYKPLPQEPETTSPPPAVEAEYTPGPVYYKPLPKSDEEPLAPVRNFLKKSDDFSRPKPDSRTRLGGLSRTRLDSISRPKADDFSKVKLEDEPQPVPDEEVTTTRRKAPEPVAAAVPKRKPSTPDFFSGFDDRSSDFGDFGTDAWDVFGQEWGQKVSK